VLVGSDYKKYSIMFRVQCETTSFNKLRLSKKKNIKIQSQQKMRKIKKKKKDVDVLILT
jgi:hypothetical protein